MLVLGLVYAVRNPPFIWWNKWLDFLRPLPLGVARFEVFAALRVATRLLGHLRLGGLLAVQNLRIAELGRLLLPAGVVATFRLRLLRDLSMLGLVLVFAWRDGAIARHLGRVGLLGAFLTSGFVHIFYLALTLFLYILTRVVALDLKIKLPRRHLHIWNVFVRRRVWIGRMAPWRVRDRHCRLLALFGVFHFISGHGSFFFHFALFICHFFLASCVFR